MIDIAEIVEFTEIQREYYISDITVRSSDQVVVLYVPTENVSETAKAGFVSEKQLANLSRKLAEKYSVGVEIIYVQTNKLDVLGRGIEMLLKAKYSDIVEEANFTFLTANRVNAWVKVKKIDDSQKKVVENFLVSIFADSDVINVDIQWVGEVDRLPSFMELLIMTKKFQPLILNTYTSKFSNDYQSINEKWLNRQLDKLIKKELIVRDSATKEYSLTGKGLSAIPNIANRTNSDITRALDLGRRKW